MSAQTFSTTYILYVAVFAIAAAACFVSLVRVREVEDAATRWGLLALLLTSGGWALAQVGFLVSPTRSLTLGWYVLGLLLGLAAVGAWLYFCSAYTNRTFHRNPTYRRLAVVVYVAVVVVKITNPLHHAYFTTTAVSTPFPHLSVHTGPLHWVAMGLSYALAFVGYFMLLELFSQIDFDTRPLSLLVAITGLPVVADIVGYATPFLIDITYEPIGVAVFAVGVAFVYLDRFDAVRLAAERDAPIVVLDSDDTVRETNRAARRLFPALATAHGASLSAVLPDVATRLDGDDPIVKIQQGNLTRYFRVTNTPYGTTKAGLGRTLVFSDVTERERYRAELERQNERLKRFASMVSHDLRNPLNVAQGRLELLRETIESDDEHAAAVERALARMDELIEDILAMARGGQPIEQWEEVTLSSIVSDCWEMVDSSAAELRLESDLSFEADSMRVQRLFENLFRNALDHVGADVTVTVGALPDRAGFYVADDGPGIPAADRDTVFEAGYTTRDEGTGFGLAIVREMVAAHGWEIQLSESETDGARFEVVGVEAVE